MVLGPWLGPMTEVSDRYGAIADGFQARLFLGELGGRRVFIENFDRRVRCPRVLPMRPGVLGSDGHGCPAHSLIAFVGDLAAWIVSQPSLVPRR